MVKVSLIITVLNEQESLDQLIEALKRQTRPADEIIVVDGGSTDQTWNLLKNQSKSWSKLRPYQLPASNRSQARNYAISQARFPIIAITDAGCIPKPNWLEEIIKPFYKSSTQVVSGYYTGLAKTIFQKCLIPYVLVMPDKIPSEFFPSTRSMAIRKSVWLKYGGFNPSNYHSEDYEYAVYLASKGINFIFAKNAVVAWIPRKTLSKASWMFFRFALGDITSGIFRPKVKHLFLRYMVLAYAFFLSLEIHPVFIPLIIACLGYVIWAIVKNYHYVKHPLAFFWLPVLQITADISVIFGTLVGLLSKAFSEPKKV